MEAASEPVMVQEKDGYRKNMQGEIDPKHFLWSNQLAISEHS